MKFSPALAIIHAGRRSEDHGILPVHRVSMVGLLHQFLLSGADHRRMDPVLGGRFRESLVSCQGRHHHLRLEFRTALLLLALIFHAPFNRSASAWPTVGKNMAAAHPPWLFVAISLQNQMQGIYFEPSHVFIGSRWLPRFIKQSPLRSRRFLHRLMGM